MARTLEEAEKLISFYEQNGSAKLFYALNRKSGELADLLNKQSLTNLDLVDAKDKSFERLKIAWNEAANIANAIKVLGDTAGITNDEEKDTQDSKYKKPITAESMADSVGELAGSKK